MIDSGRRHSEYITSFWASRLTANGLTWRSAMLLVTTLRPICTTIALIFSSSVFICHFYNHSLVSCHQTSQSIEMALITDTNVLFLGNTCLLDLSATIAAGLCLQINTCLPSQPQHVEVQSNPICVASTFKIAPHTSCVVSRSIYSPYL